MKVILIFLYSVFSFQSAFAVESYYYVCRQILDGEALERSFVLRGDFYMGMSRREVTFYSEKLDFSSDEAKVEALVQLGMSMPDELIEGTVSYGGETLHFASPNNTVEIYLNKFHSESVPVLYTDKPAEEFECFDADLFSENVAFEKQK